MHRLFIFETLYFQFYTEIDEIKLERVISLQINFGVSDFIVASS